ncbi:MAG TPA: type II toxin-antitoxin system VapC family toxin [Solirubrobacterales bacterium]|nr:type II toxin-antitoxin system VapC family toxin [Solirubrobacterales bacterium]
MIVLDASVLIGHLNAGDPHHAAARTLIEESGAMPLGASAISLAETLVAPARAGRLEEAEAVLGRLGIAALDLGSGAPTRLAALRATTGRKLPDCCVLLAAQEHEGMIATFDHDLAKAAGALGIEAIA